MELIKNIKTEWIKCSERLPPLSYVESDNPDDSFEPYEILIYMPQYGGGIFTAVLLKIQDEDSWNFGDFVWEIIIPTDDPITSQIDFEEVSHWSEIIKEE